VIRALDDCKISLKLVWDCHKSLLTLAEHNNVQLLWMPGHKGIEGNETANQLAKRGLLHPITGPEPACGVSERVARQAIRDWMCREHRDYWQSISG
jgi:hypothetical protein